MRPSIAHPRLHAMAMLLGLTSALVSGCSSELASFQDTYVPASVDENYPIKVVERPVQLTVDAATGGLRHGDTQQVTRFAQAAAASRLPSPVVVSYPAASKAARKVASQAAGLIAQQGVPRQSIIVTPRDGKGNVVTMTFARKVAETRECGDWSQNMRANQWNDTGPNFGCAFQQNFAAMVTNPEDFEHPRPMTPAMSAAQSAALATYQAGTWTTPTSDSTFSSSSGF